MPILSTFIVFTIAQDIQKKTVSFSSNNTLEIYETLKLTVEKQVDKTQKQSD